MLSGRPIEAWKEQGDLTLDPPDATRWIEFAETGRRLRKSGPALLMRGRFTLFGGAGGMSTEEVLLFSDKQLRGETFVPPQVPNCCMQGGRRGDHPWLGKSG